MLLVQLEEVANANEMLKGIDIKGSELELHSIFLRLQSLSDTCDQLTKAEHNPSLSKTFSHETYPNMRWGTDDKPRHR
jgi:hypothetical protein